MLRTALRILEMNFYFVLMPEWNAVSSISEDDKSKLKGILLKGLVLGGATLVGSMTFSLLTFPPHFRLKIHRNFSLMSSFSVASYVICVETLRLKPEKMLFTHRSRESMLIGGSLGCIYGGLSGIPMLLPAGLIGGSIAGWCAYNTKIFLVKRYLSHLGYEDGNTFLGRNDGSHYYTNEDYEAYLESRFFLKRKALGYIVKYYDRTIDTQISKRKALHKKRLQMWLESE